MMTPLPDDEHQELQLQLATIAQVAIAWPGLGQVRAGTNVSDRIKGWTHNYRCPDVAVYLTGSRARNCGTHWCGGPDFPWALELFRLSTRQLRKVGRSTAGRPRWLASTVIPLRFRLVRGDPRPVIEVAHADGVQHWTV
jgi:hypothetical protein